MFLQGHIFHKLISLLAWLAWTKWDCGREQRTAGLCDTKWQYRAQHLAHGTAKRVKSCRCTTRVGGLVLIGLCCHPKFLSLTHPEFLWKSNSFPVRSRLYEEARTRLLCNFPRRFREFIVPCFVSDGISSDRDIQEQPPWRYVLSCPD